MNLVRARDAPVETVTGLSGIGDMLPHMEGHLRRVARRQRGLFTRAQARACGYSAKQIRHRVRAGRWQAVIGSTLDPRDVLLSDGARVTSRERTIVDCLRLLPEADAQSLLDRALQRRWMDLDRLAWRVGMHSGRPGKHRLVRLLKLASACTISEAERVAARLLRGSGITGWRANQPIYEGTDVIAVGDLVFEGVRLVIEVDGWTYHGDADAFQRDRQRQNRLVAAGWTVLRFTWWDLTQRPDYVVASICAMMIRRAG
jgi:very-short-patch-repair endonuclease